MLSDIRTDRDRPAERPDRDDNEARARNEADALEIPQETGLLIGNTGDRRPRARLEVEQRPVCWVLDTYRLIRIPMDVYQVAYVPFVVQAIDLTVVVVAAVLICFLATLYPSRQASRLDPVQALRFE